VVIYANHLLRATYPPMTNAARCAFLHGGEADTPPMRVDQRLQFIPFAARP
jgi:hypothetical protein